MSEEVLSDKNTSSLGPYSFNVLVNCCYSLKHNEASAPQGRRALLPGGNGKRKRTSSASLLKDAKRNANKKLRAEKENSVPVFPRSDETEPEQEEEVWAGRKTRSSQRLNRN